MSKKRRRLRKGRVLIALLILGCFVSVLGIQTYQYFFENKTNEIKKDKADLVEEQNQEKEYTLSMVMVGDNLIHDKIYLEAEMNANGNGYDFRPMLEMIKPIVQKYDIAYYNQETILGGSEIGVSSYPAFNSPYEVGDAMIDAGFNLVSLATNHTLDRGEQAILNSREYWNSKEQVLAVGSYASEEERNQVKVLEKNHITYTLLNYTYGTNGIRVPSGKEYLVNVWQVSGNDPSRDVNYQNYKETVRKDIEMVRSGVDVLMVAMHWGVEYQETPNLYQKDMAEFLASLGVDIIIGTHPHVIEPIEWIGDTLVIYSLGNFISAHEVINMANRVGLMSSLDIVKKENSDGTIEIRLEHLQNELLYTYYTKDYHNFLVVPFSKMNEGYLSNYREVYQQYKSVVQGIDSSIDVVPLE